MSSAIIDPQRFWNSLEEHGSIGATADGGVNREALTIADKQGRDLFVQWCLDAGLEVGIDRLGTIYATRKGEDNSLKPLAIGSHLDTQPTGGRYDGVLGVLAGLEVVRALNDAGAATHRPVTIVNWSNEEGSRFVPSMAASGVYAGVFSFDQVAEETDSESVRFLDALKASGYAGTEKVGKRKFDCYLELHIEQGPILEDLGVDVGVVTGSQGMNFSHVTIGGTPAHAGTTPMDRRRDPMTVAARLLQDIFDYANGLADARATVGMFEALPGSHSTIPHTVRFTLDLRHPDEAALVSMLRHFETGMAAARDAGFDVSRREFGTVDAKAFDARCVEAIRSAAEAGGWRHADIVSGAGHDATYINAVCPTGMIFVPCEGGVSHNPAERISPEHAAAGADVLLRATLDLANR